MDNSSSMQPLNVSNVPYPDYPPPIIYPQLNTQGLRSIFIGSLFVFIAIRIGGFDIFPDFVGYIMILSGLGKMAQYSRYFNHAKIFAFFLLLFSLRDIVKVEDVSVGIPLLPDWFYIYNFISAFALMLVQIGFMFCITSGITQIAEMTHYTPFFNYGRKIYIFKLLGYIGGYLFAVLTPMLIGVYERTEYAVVALLGIVIIAEVVYLVFLRRAYKQMHGLAIINANGAGNQNSDKKRLKGTAASVIGATVFTAGLLLFSYHYVNKTFIYNFNTFPKAVKEKLDIDYRRFEKGVKIDCFYDLGGKGGFIEADRFDDPDKTVKELIEYVDKIVRDERNRGMYHSSSNESVWDYIFGNNVTYYGETINFQAGSNSPWGPEGADYYNILILTHKGTFNIRICDEENWVTIEERRFAISDELRADFIGYIKENIIDKYK